MSICTWASRTIRCHCGCRNFAAVVTQPDAGEYVVLISCCPSPATRVMEPMMRQSRLVTRVIHEWADSSPGLIIMLRWHPCRYIWSIVFVMVMCVDFDITPSCENYHHSAAGRNWSPVIRANFFCRLLVGHCWIGIVSSRQSLDEVDQVDSHENWRRCWWPLVALVLYVEARRRSLTVKWWITEGF